ncbi:metallophosphoesterase [Rufibacter tibetensis]|uniref:DNA mismatch repair protein MutT n=1 Tax=Rufibacter tibetensis TaxID=512763 RepID=A0A0N7HW72_9BACT|nr:metallophosphoesterase [Rufibacter tibetensis]ALI98440.1 DNA mismatch repair protein MutT [Rufibacter tibetensis]
MTRLIITLILVLVIDIYVFQAVRTVAAGFTPGAKKAAFIVYWAISLFTLGTLLLALLTRGSAPNPMRMQVANVLFILFVSKVVIVLFLFLDDLVRLVQWLSNTMRGPDQPKFDVSRHKFMSQLALIMGALPFATLIWGMVKGAYDYQVKKVTLRFPNLPPAFDGFRLLQITDMHSGSFHSAEPLEKAVAIINQQAADVVVFTGDIVNNVASEVEPYIPTLAKIKAKNGVFSILGNHDYGDYVAWESREAKMENLNTLVGHHRRAGWDILLNEHRVLERNGQQIALLGVENWGHRMNFPKYGILSKAYAGTEKYPFKILLSHDPSHWDGEVNIKYPDIDLMLSGHTHGMQFGVNIPGWKWSPVQYVYKQWAGLYQKGRQYLYVNVGLGFLGYHGRVGFLPEITVFEFKRA